MVSKCANPECSAPFHYLREGKLFQLEVDGTEHGSLRPGLVGKPAHHIEHFWLCGACCATMTLAVDRVRGVVTVPLDSPAIKRATAS